MQSKNPEILANSCLGAVSRVFFQARITVGYWVKKYRIQEVDSLLGREQHKYIHRLKHRHSHTYTLKRIHTHTFTHTQTHIQLQGCLLAVGREALRRGCIITNPSAEGASSVELSTAQS